MATYVDSIVASPRLESLLSRGHFDSSWEDSEDGGEVTTEDEMIEKRKGCNFATDFPMRMLVYLFYVITFSWITALTSPANPVVYYSCCVCRGICQTLSILLMMVVMVLRTYIEMGHYFEPDSVNCSFLITNQLTSNDSEDHILLRVYLWDISYDFTGLACLVYLVFYSYTTADISPHNIIINTRKIRSSIAKFENYQFLRGSLRKRRNRECNKTKITELLIALWQCILILIVTTLTTTTVFYFYMGKVWNKDCEKDHFCCISKILAVINSPQRYLSPVILCLLNRTVSVNLQTAIILNSVQTFTNLTTSPQAGWIKERYFEILSRINRYSDKFRTVIALNTISALLGMSSLLIAHLFTAEGHLTQVWKSGAISMSIVYLTYFVLISCVWMSVDGTAGYRRLIRRYSDDLMVLLHTNKNNLINEGNQHELNIIAISANESQRYHFLIALRFVLLSGIIGIVVLALIGIVGYNGWKGFQI